jgi:tetratricopeptide (TPR) repeat protein
MGGVTATTADPSQPPGSDEGTEPGGKLVWKVSSSLDSARPGEVLLLDDQGRVLGPSAMRRATVIGWGVVGSVVGVGAGAIGVLMTPVAGLVVGAMTLGFLVWQLRHGRDFQKALALASAGRRDEAFAIVSELERRQLGNQFPPFIDYLAGKLEWQRGNAEEALRRYERALAALARMRGRGRGMYWICTFDRVQLLAAMGRLDDARAARAELEEAPRGDYFAMELALTDLMIAFHGGDASTLPGDDELYEWAKAALRTSRFGASVVLLGWAFEQRGDRDMAEHMLREAPARLDTEFLAETTPKLNAWLQERLPTVGAKDDDDLARQIAAIDLPGDGSAP